MERKIMIVDDDKEFLDEIAEILSTNGFRAIAVNDAELAPQTALKENPDLILLDLKMPKKSGFEVASEISDMASHIPIVAMSAFVNSGYVAFLEACGIKEKIKKPFTEEEILNKIDEAFRNK